MSSSSLREKLMLAKAPPPGQNNGSPPTSQETLAEPLSPNSSSGNVTTAAGLGSPGSSKLFERMRGVSVPPGSTASATSPSDQPGSGTPQPAPGSTAESPRPSSLLMKLAAASPPPSPLNGASSNPAQPPLQSSASSINSSGGAMPSLMSNSSGDIAAMASPTTSPVLLQRAASADEHIQPSTLGGGDSTGVRSSPLMRKLAGSQAPVVLPPPGSSGAEKLPLMPPSAILGQRPSPLATASSTSMESLGDPDDAGSSSPPVATSNAPVQATGSPSTASATTTPWTASGGSSSTSPQLARPGGPRFVPLNRSLSITSSARGPGGTAIGLIDATANLLVLSPANVSSTSGSPTESTTPIASSIASSSQEDLSTFNASPSSASVPTGGSLDDSTLGEGDGGFRRGTGKSDGDTIRLSHGRRIGQRPVSMYGNVLGREDSLGDLLKEAGDQYGKAFALASKKLSTANKQLIVVAKYASAGPSALAGSDSSKKKSSKKDSSSANSPNVGLQLAQAKEMLETANKTLDVDLRELSTNFDDALVTKVVVTLGNAAKATTFLVNSCKAMVMERPDQPDLYKQVVTATRTVRDAVGLCSDTLAQAPMYLQNANVTSQINMSLRTVKQSLAQLVMSQAAQTGEHLIPATRRCELLAAISASVVSCMRLLWLRASNEDEAVVEMTTVCATSVSQLATCLQECANSDVMLTQPQYQDQLSTEWCQLLKDAFVAFVDETRNTLGVPSEADAGDTSPAYDRFLREVETVLAGIEQMAVLQASTHAADSAPIAFTAPQLEAARKTIRGLIPKAPPKPPVGSTESSRDAKDSGQTASIWSEGPDSAENVLLAADGRLRAATLNKILERLTMADPPADITNLVKTFVTTYRSMATPGEVLRRLIERWDVPPEREGEMVPIRLRVVNLLRSWAEANFNDFAPDDIAKLRDYVDSKLMASPPHQKFGVLLGDFIKKRLTSHVDDVKQTLVELKLEPKIPLSPSKFISVFDEMEIAKQLTLVEFSIYKAIQPVELLSQSWNVEKLKYRARNVRAMIQRSTALSMWVAGCILWQPTLKDRARVLTRVIRIAEHLRRFNNFNSLMAIISGLNLSSVRRLKHTWSELNPSDVKSFETLEQVMSSDSSFAFYRNSIKNVNPPCVPFLGVYLTDLTFSDDGNPDFVNGLINFSKREQIYTVIQDLLQYQNTPYNVVTSANAPPVRFQYVDNIAAFLKELPQNSDNDLYKMSTLVEPKNSDKSTII